MGSNFDPTTPDHWTASTAVVSGTPATFATWVQLDTLSGTQRLIVVGTSATDTDLLAMNWISGSGGLLEVQHYDGGSEVATQALTDTNLHHVCGVFASDSSRTSYIDGIAGSENTTTQDALAGMDYTDLGDLDWPGGRIQGLNGNLYEAAIWNVALTAAEIAALADGVSPVLIRASSLVLYQDLIRGINRPGIGPVMTVTGTTVVDHIGMFYPSRPSIITAPAAAVGTILPQMMQHGLYTGSIS